MNTETLAFYASKRSTMTTQTTTNSLEVVPHKTAWQVVPPPRSESIETILERLIRTSDEMAMTIAKIEAILERK